MQERRLAKSCTFALFQVETMKEDLTILMNDILSMLRDKLGKWVEHPLYEMRA